MSRVYCKLAETDRGKILTTNFKESFYTSQVKSSQFYLYSPKSQITNLPQGALHHNLYNIQYTTPSVLRPLQRKSTKTPRKNSKLLLLLCSATLILILFVLPTVVYMDWHMQVEEPVVFTQLTTPPNTKSQHITREATVHLVSCCYTSHGDYIIYKSDI